MGNKFSVIIATLNRPTLQTTLKSLYAQTYQNFEIKIGIMPEVNEYECRNRLAKESTGDVLAIIDDDAYADKRWLEIANKIFSKSSALIATGAVIGNLLGQGEMTLDRKYWGVGTNMFIRRKTLEEIGGFETNWGLEKARGWRGDTDILWRILEKYGEDSYVHSSELIVYHPNPFQSQWDPKVEVRFYQRWREKCVKYFVPYDPRLCQVILAVENDEKYIKEARKYLDEFIKVGIITEEQVRAGIEFVKKFI